MGQVVPVNGIIFPVCCLKIKALLVERQCLIHSFKLQKT